MPSPPGSAVSYLSDPLPEDTTVIGAGAVSLWVRSSAPDVDLQATISEVRPDGKETSCKTAGCGETSASSTPRRAPRSSRC